MLTFNDIEKLNLVHHRQKGYARCVVLKGRYRRKRRSTDNVTADAVMQVFARSLKKSARQYSHGLGIKSTH
jgi:hypothetical protein